MTGETGSKEGLKTAVAELHDPAAPVPGAIDGEQLDMLPLGNLSVERNLAVVRGRGRPAGAKNKNTQEWRDFLLARYTSPLEGLAWVCNVPVNELASMLGTTRLEAFKLQITAMKELAPYVHQKMPQALDLGDKGLINLVLNTLPASVAAVGDQAKGMIIEVLNESEQNQIFSRADIKNSNGSTSNDASQPHETTGDNGNG